MQHKPVLQHSACEKTTPIDKWMQVSTVVVTQSSDQRVSFAPDTTLSGIEPTNSEPLLEQSLEQLPTRSVSAGARAEIEKTRSSTSIVYPLPEQEEKLNSGTV